MEIKKISAYVQDLLNLLWQHSEQQVIQDKIMEIKIFKIKTKSIDIFKIKIMKTITLSLDIIFTKLVKIFKTLT